MITKADLHFHGDWAYWKDCIKEIKQGKNPLCKLDYFLFTSGLDVLAYTDFVAEKGRSFWRELLIPSLAEISIERGINCEKIDDFNIVFGAGTRKPGYLTLTQEIDSKDGHILAVGAKAHIAPGRTLLDTCKEIINAGGLIIPAHPLAASGIGEKNVRMLAGIGYKGSNMIHALELNNDLWRTPLATTPIVAAVLKNMPVGLAKKVGNSSYLANQAVIQLAKETGLPLVANSDAHDFRIVSAYTEYQHPPNLKGMDAVTYAIKNGNTAAVMLDGRENSLTGFIWHGVRTQFLNPERKGLSSQEEVKEVFRYRDELELRSSMIDGCNN